jgi:hypothetical protein
MKRSNVDDSKNNDFADLEKFNRDRADAATRIQAIQRRKLARQQVNSKRQGEHEAASKIQAVQRGKRDRKMIQIKRRTDLADPPTLATAKGTVGVNSLTEVDKSAIKIQSMQRSKIASRRVQKEKAARTIQAVERRRATQKKMNDTYLKKKNTKKKWMDELDNSAIKIQSLQRKKLARRRVQNEKAARTIQVAQRRRKSTENKSTTKKRWGHDKNSDASSNETSTPFQNNLVDNRNETELPWASTYDNWGDNLSESSERGSYDATPILTKSYERPNRPKDADNIPTAQELATEYFERQNFPAIDNILNESMVTGQMLDPAVPMFAVHRQD